MTLLEDIIEGASGDEVGVATLLRKVKVLAARIETARLDTWVNQELSGYPDDAELPEYRGPFPAEVVGHFAGPFGATIENAPIPPIGFPENMRDGFLFRVAFTQPISELERFAQASESLRNIWPADAVAYTNQLIQKGEASLYPGHGLLQAWKNISPHHISGIVDTVRTRVLDLALALEQLAPDAGERGAPTPAPGPVQSIVNNIYGHGNNLAWSASGDVRQTVVAKGDEDALLQAVADAGVPGPEVDALREALAADRDDAGGDDPDGPGPRVREWLGRLALGAGGVASSAAGGVVAELVKSYFGI